jgi:hypothetical protein
MTGGTIDGTTTALAAMIPVLGVKTTARTTGKTSAETVVRLAPGQTGVSAAAPGPGPPSRTIGGIEAAPAAVMSATALARLVLGLNGAIALGPACGSAAEIRAALDLGIVTVTVIGGNAAATVTATKSGKRTARKTKPRKKTRSDGPGAAPALSRAQPARPLA